MRFHPPQTVSNAALQAFYYISSPDQQRVGDSDFLPVVSHFIMSDYEQRVGVQPFLCYHTSSTIPWPIGCEWHCLYFFRQRASCHYQQVVSGTACCPARYSHHVLNRMWVTLPFFLLWSVINSHAMINSMSVTVSSILYMHSHLFFLIICRKWVTLPFCFPGSLITSYPIINRLWLSLPSSTKQSHYLSSHD